eukprot:3439918-Lingulodinium_polyedra.AAC.1
MSDTSPILGGAATRAAGLPTVSPGQSGPAPAGSPRQSPRTASGARSDADWNMVGSSAARSTAGSTARCSSVTGSPRGRSPPACS